MIDDEAFLRIRDAFRYLSLKAHPQIKVNISDKVSPHLYHRDVDVYFQNLLGEHYVY